MIKINITMLKNLDLDYCICILKARKVVILMRYDILVS
jgi:hypothetical protein